MNGQAKNNEHWIQRITWVQERPTDVRRPLGSVEIDRRGGVQTDMNFQQQRQFWEAKNAKFKALGESRKNRKRQDTRSDTAK